MAIEPHAGGVPGGESAGTGDGRNLPVRQLDRAALERVLVRAAELQGRARGVVDPAEALSEDQLLEIGREVGLAPHHLRQALAEERAHIELEPASGAMGRVFGPSVASAARTIPGRPAGVLAQLDEWMKREECLQVKRRLLDRIIWEARRDLFGNLARGLNFGRRGYHLTRADDVAATVVEVDEARVLVRLDATLERARTGRVHGSVGLASAGVVTSGIGLAIGVLVPIALIPAVVLAGGAWSTARGHFKTVERVQLALEQVLDKLEYGEMAAAPSILNLLGPPRRQR